MTDFGSDISCIFDSTPEFSEVSGLRVVAEAIARRHITPRGQLIKDPNYGSDMTRYLNADLSATDIAQISAESEAECVKDERVLAATTIVQVTPQGTLLLNITLTTADGPFTLVLAVSDVTVQLLTVGL